MTVALSLLADLRRRGVRVTANGERLHLDAPRGVLSPGEIERLRAVKAEVLAELQREALSGTPRLGPVGELVVPLDAPASFRWWEAEDDAERARRFRAAREAAGVTLQ